MCVYGRGEALMQKNNICIKMYIIFLLVIFLFYSCNKPSKIQTQPDNTEEFNFKEELYETPEVLEKKGYAINNFNIIANTIKHNDIEGIYFLKNNDVNFNVRFENYGLTPLMYICLLPFNETRYSILCLLLNFGVDITLVDDMGLSCFNYAGYANNYEYLKTLVKYAIYEKYTYSDLKLLNTYKFQVDLFDDFHSGLPFNEFKKICNEKKIEFYECLIDNVISEKINEFELLKPDILYRVDYGDYKTIFYFQNEKLVAMSNYYRNGDIDKIIKKYFINTTNVVPQNFDWNKDLYKENHTYIPEFLNFGTTLYVFSVPSKLYFDEKDIHCVCIDNQAYLEAKSFALIEGLLLEKEKNNAISDMNKTKDILESQKEIMETFAWVSVIKKLFF